MLSHRHTPLGIISALSLFGALTANAIQFNQGELKGSFDTTISVGGLYRLNDPDRDLYGTTSTFEGLAGRQNSVNSDDGNLNFPKGFASQIAKVSHDLELRYKKIGGLVRGYYFYDYAVEKNWKGRTALSKEARDRVGRGAEWLDMYAYAKLELAGHPVDLRFGRQVLSLGESTFIPNGINVVNPVDLSKLRVPGAELKEALLPVNMVKASIGISENLTLEPFWLLEFRRNEIEPAGSYFSTNDFASRGGSKVMLGFGALPDSGALGGIPRDPNREHGNYDQGGLAARILAPSLNDTEFGLYFVRYHSRSPVISARTPSAGINTNLTGPLTQVLLSQAGPNPSAATIAAAQAQASAIFTAYATSKVNPAALTPTQAAMLQSASVQAAIAGAGKIALLTAAAGGRYFIEYPDAIQMVGASFNTNLAKTGISWQGEISYKHDVPLQVDDVELLFATLSSLSPAFGGTSNQMGSYLGQYWKEIPGFRRHDVWTAQSTMTKVFGPTLGADQLTLLGEVGGVWADLPSKDVLRYDGPGSFTSGSAAAMAATGNGTLPATPAEAFADPFSWGYQLVAKADFNNAFAGVNVSPSLAFTHDVSGTTPLPLGNFISGRRSLTIGAEFTYQNRWTLDLRYVNFFGARPYNLLSDRDYVSATVKYSF
jgi:hypothetical protein